MAWHSASVYNITTNSATLQLSSDGSWASTTVYVRNGGFSGTLLNVGGESGANQYYSGGVYYLNIYLSNLTSGYNYALYISFQTASGATNLTDCSPTNFTTSSPLPFRGSLESPYSGYSESGTTINVSGYAWDESGISSIKIYIDNVLKATTYTDYYDEFSYNVDLANITFTSHTLKVIAITGNSVSYIIDTITFYREAPRPSDWNWSYSIYSGGDVYSTTKTDNNVTAYIMRATEWNNFTSRINEFRTYKGLSTVSFYVISSGSSCTSTVINQAVNAINGMVSYLLSVSTVSDKGEVPAWVFNNMRTALNSI